MSDLTDDLRYCAAIHEGRARHDCIARAADALEAAEAKLAAIDALCARHGITVEGIVALVDDTFRMTTEPEHADITEAVEAGLNHDDMYYAGWEVGYFDAVTAARRLARGEEA